MSCTSRCIFWSVDFGSSTRGTSDENMRLVFCSVLHREGSENRLSPAAGMEISTDAPGEGGRHDCACCTVVVMVSGIIVLLLVLVVVVVVGGVVVVDSSGVFQKLMLQDF